MEMQLFDSDKRIPTITEVKMLDNVRFHSIRDRGPGAENCRFLHGVIIAKYQGSLYACWACNVGEENSDTEVVCGCCSNDDGATWSEGRLWLDGDGKEGVSHGAFLANEHSLWGFFPHFTGIRENVRTYLWQMQEDGTWKKICRITEEPFWPLGEPQKMENGNYIMPGVYVGGSWGSTENPPAVAISQKDDLTNWKVIKIPKAEDVVLWGEAGVLVNRNKVCCVSRNWYKDPVARAAVSEDFGETWTIAERTNLWMADSKPAAGTLKNGTRYLICTTLADNGHLRYPLTIALGRGGEYAFQEVKCIRKHDAERDSELKQDQQLLLAYPYTTEADGKLYVTYSVGVTGSSINNYNNAAELAVIETKQL